VATDEVEASVPAKKKRTTKKKSVKKTSKKTTKKTASSYEVSGYQFNYQVSPSATYAPKSKEPEEDEE
jgi:hypothetical protein